MKIPLQSGKRSSINEPLHLFTKDEKGYPFYQLALVATRRQKGTLFLSILLSLKTIGKGVKFQEIRATFTNTIANGIINNSYLLYLTEFSGQNAHIYTIFSYE